MENRAKRYIALLLAVLTLALTGCGQSEKPQEEYIEGHSAGKEIEQTAAADDVFTLNVNMEYSFNPMVATNTANQLVCYLVYENMVEVDNNYNAIPNVITEWKTSDGGVHWVFTVDTSRRFHTGEQMTAKDVAYSLRMAMNSERFARRLNCIIGCSENDEKTFAVTCSKANMLLPQLLAVPVIQYDSYKEDYPEGTGPYTYAKDHKTLKRFSRYKNAENLPLDVIYLKEYTGSTEIMSAFEDSLIDIVMNDPSAPTNLGYANVNEIRGMNTCNLHYIGFNMKSKTVAYEGIRYAFNFAFDREDIVEQFGGYALAANLPVSPACAWYDQAYAKQYNYNIEQTKLVFENLGLKDYDEDGYLELKNGGSLQELDIDFVICGASSIKSNVASKFASDMASLGLKITVRELPWEEYCAAIASGDFDMYYAEVRLTPDFDLSMLTGKDMRMNYGGIEDTMLDELIERYLGADDANRKSFCADMCAQIANMGYIIPLCFEKHQMITHRGVIEGIKASEFDPLYNFANWKIKFENVTLKPAEENENNNKGETDNDQ